ncbi:transmembrane protein, putative [Bodo saltans]|uniref:Transmembrane protein, putative n=1 Tax=Bodo saltans TaxID=75058 RepID=A0A0S4JMD3_BODSA|nr:transmembrane protein, putative [Bodo saltans]|eukprot:CUG91805.1 transmembrane protein, putative [Bodo saltans]
MTTSTTASRTNSSNRVIAAANTAAVDVQDLDEDAALQYEKSIAFRLSNKPEGSLCLRVAYVSYDEFKPDPTELSRMAIFRRCLGLEDFHLIVSAVNAQLRSTRSLSFGISLAAVFLTFACVVISVLVSVVGGVSGQVAVILIHTALQALIRMRCKSSLNKFLEAHVNPKLRELRSLYVVFQVILGSFSQWCEIDFVSTSPINPLFQAPLDEVEPRVDQREEGHLEQHPSIRVVVLGVEPKHSFHNTQEGSVKT